MHELLARFTLAASRWKYTWSDFTSYDYSWIMYCLLPCCFGQVQVGDVRLMLPCGDSQPTAGQEEGAPISAGGGLIAAEPSNSAFASGDLDLGQQAPNMLVVVLAGFQATSRTTEARVSQFASPGMTHGTMSFVVQSRLLAPECRGSWCRCCY